jgi:hypothetical protein
MGCEDIEDASSWAQAQPKREGQFFDYLISNRWLDAIGDEPRVYRLHDWAEHNPWAADAMSRRDQSRHAAHIQHHVNKGQSKPLACSWCADSMPGAELRASSSTAPAPYPAPAPNPSPSPSPSRSGRGGGEKDDHDDRDRFPLWTHRQFQFKADKIAEWIDRQRAKRLVPGDEDFDTAFVATWGMSYDYWIEQRDRHEQHFRRAS